MVDIARSSDVIRKKKIRRAIYGAVAAPRHHPHHRRRVAAEAGGATVDRATVWVDTVKRGPMLRQVRGSGTLVPEDIRWISGDHQGRVERIVLRRARRSTPDTRHPRAEQPELQQSVTEAQLAYQSAQAAYENRKAELESALLSQQSDVAEHRGELQAGGARPRGQRATVQGRPRLRAAGQAEARAGGRAEEPPLASRRQRLEMTPRRGQVAARAAGSGQSISAAPQYELRVRQLDDLKVKAGMTASCSASAHGAGRRRRAGRPGHQPRARRQSDAT